MLTNHLWYWVTFIAGQFHKTYLVNQLQQLTCKLLIYNFITISQWSMSSTDLMPRGLWQRRLLVAAVQPGTGKRLGILGFAQPFLPSLTTGRFRHNDLINQQVNITIRCEGNTPTSLLVFSSGVQKTTSSFTKASGLHNCSLPFLFKLLRPSHLLHKSEIQILSFVIENYLFWFCAHNEDLIDNTLL